MDLDADTIAVYRAVRASADTTEKVYWKVMVPELRRGAEVMDRLFT